MSDHPLRRSHCDMLPARSQRSPGWTQWPTDRLLALAVLFIPFVSCLFVCCGTELSAADPSLNGNLFTKISMSETVSTPPASSSSASATPNVFGVTSLCRWLEQETIACEIEGDGVLVDANEFLNSPADPTANKSRLRLSVDADAGLLGLEWMTPRSDLPDGGLAKTHETLAQHSTVHLQRSGTQWVFKTYVSTHTVSRKLLNVRVARLSQAAKAIDALSVTAADQPNTNRPSSRTNTPSATAGTKTQPDAGADSPNVSLLGTWSAKTSSTEAWAVRFSADNQFVLVHTRNGKNAVSRGRYQLAANRLSLADAKGLALQGTLTKTSPSALQWSIENNDGQTALSLVFQKQ